MSQITTQVYFNPIGSPYDQYHNLLVIDGEQYFNDLLKFVFSMVQFIPEV